MGADTFELPSGEELGADTFNVATTLLPPDIGATFGGGSSCREAIEAVAMHARRVIPELEFHYFLFFSNK